MIDCGRIESKKKGKSMHARSLVRELDNKDLYLLVFPKSLASVLPFEGGGE